MGEGGGHQQHPHTTWTLSLRRGHSRTHFHFHTRKEETPRRSGVISGAIRHGLLPVFFYLSLFSLLQRQCRIHTNTFPSLTPPPSFSSFYLRCAMSRLITPRQLSGWNRCIQPAASSVTTLHTYSETTPDDKKRPRAHVASRSCSGRDDLVIIYFLQFVFPFFFGFFHFFLAAGDNGITFLLLFNAFF